MSKEDEYHNILEESNHTSLERADTPISAEPKIKSSWKRRLWSRGLGSLTVFWFIFIFLVNGSTTFAYTCGKVPFIKELAQFVAFSPSLSAAVENQYVQPMELEVVKDDITARVEYVIVDQKQLNIFYSLDSKRYTALSARPDISGKGGEVLEYGLSSGAMDVPNGELRHITIDFIDKDVPDSMELRLVVGNLGSFIKTEEIGEAFAQDGLLDRAEEMDESDNLTEINFLLELNPYYTAQGETLTLNQTFEIDRQTLKVTTVDIYPTHIRINLEDEEENTAWLRSLAFYMTNEKGKRYESILNGITATGDTDSPMMGSHRLESPFFSDAKSLTLHITGVAWLNKGMEKVEVDLKNKRAEVLPEGVVFKKADRLGKNWLLTFSGEKLKEDASYQLWNTTYYDELGKEYRYNSWSTHTVYYDEETNEHIEKPTTFEVEFALENYPSDTVYLSPVYSRRVHLDKPMEIKIK